MSVKDHLPHLKHFLVLLSLVTVLIIPSFVFVSAQDSQSMPSASERLQNVGEGEGGSYAQASETTVSEIVGIAVNAFLGLLGIIFIILILVGGAKYMTAAGNEERAKSALALIRHAIIGLIIVVSSYAIWNFLLENLIFR